MVIRLKRLFSDFIKRIGLSKSKQTVRSLARQVYMWVVVNEQLPVPTEFLVYHIKNAGDMHNNVKLEWKGKSDRYQYVVIDKLRNKRRHCKTGQTVASMSLEPGLYNVAVRACPSATPMRRGRWSNAITFAVREDSSIAFGLEAKAYRHQTRKDYYLNCLNIKQAIARKETILSTPPLSLAVLLEGRGCNLKCIYCTHIAIDGDDISFRPEYAPGKKLRFQVGRTFGTSETLINSIEQITPYLLSVRFGGGEPLMYPEFKKVAGMVKSHPNIILSVCTNGNLITDEMIDDIFLMPNFRWLAISMDGVTQKTYEKIRVNGNFKKVCNTVKKITAKRGKHPFPKVQFNFVIMRSNYKEVLKLLDLANNLGVEAVNYMMLITAHPILFSGRPVLQRFHERLQKENLLAEHEMGAEILGTMQQVREKAAELGIMLRPDRVSSYIYSKFPELSPSPSRPTILKARAEEDDTRIGTPWEDVDDSDEYLDYEEESKTNKFIDWKRVFCHQPFANLSAGHYRLNFCCFAKRQFSTAMSFDNDELTVMDLWNHPKIVEARRLMYEGRADLVCRTDCPFLATGGLKRPDLMI